MSPPMNAPVLSDKMAYGNGVLRRLSFTSGFAKVRKRSG
jgi:hypothetical protein